MDHDDLHRPISRTASEALSMSGLTSRMRRHWRRNLRTRTLVGLIAMVWLVVTLYAMIDAYLRQVELLERAQENADRIASLMSDALARPLYDFNTAGAESAARALAAFPEIVSARVLDHEGKSVADNLLWHPGVSAPIHVKREILFIDDNRTTPVGTLEFSMSTQSIDSEVLGLLKRAMIISLLLSAAIISAVMLLFRSVTKPLGDIYSALEKLARNETDIALSGLQREDELGRVSLAVNQFRESIRRRTQVENELEAMVEENRAILDNALVGIALVREGCLAAVNRRVEELLLLPEESLIGSGISGFFVDHEEYQALAKETSKAFSHGQAVSCEVRLRRASGEVFWGALTGRTIGSASGPQSAIWVIADIDERRRAQEELELHRLHLETIVEQRTRQLTQARQEAQNANEAKSRFLATMTHEIRTPMNAIVGLSQLALQTRLTAQQRDYLDKIVLSGRIMLQLINDILDLSKIEAGRLELDNHVFNVADVLEQAVTVGRNLAETKGLRFTVETGCSVPGFMIGDDLRLTQVLNNLIGNAVKFTDTGEITLSCECHQTGADQTTLRFRVRDTGIGLTRQQRQRLFKPFTQADSSTTRKYGGTGLGLAISRQIVHLMGGTIALESTPNVGSTFLIEIPFTRASEEQCREARNQHALEGLDTAITNNQNSFKGVRILLAEDNEINQQVTVEYLALVGAKVDVAENGRLALEALSKGNYDLVLMDMMMPEMDGLDATAAMRRNERWKDIPVIALTANATSEHRQRCQEVGMNDFITKPVEAALLYRKIGHWLNLSETRPARSACTPGTGTTGATLPPCRGIDGELLLRRMAGKVEFCLQVLKKFRENNLGTWERMANAIHVSEWQEAHRLAHTLKGSAGTIAAAALAEHALKLEEACAAADHTAAGIALAELRPCLDTLLTELAPLTGKK